MAEDLKITLETKLNQAREDLRAIQGAGGLSGPGGAKALNKIQALFDTLERQDISKLDAKGFNRWLNDFAKLNHYIQSAGRDLSTYSKEYTAQQQKVEQANEKLSKAQDKETEALKKQEEAFKKYADSKATYYNKVTGKQVKNPYTVSSLYEKGQLEIRDSNKEVMKPGAPLEAVKANLDKMVEANKEVQVAQQEVEAAEVTLKAEKISLEEMPSGGSTHPVTTQVDTHAAGNYDLIRETKEKINISQGKENQALSDDIDANIDALNKQSTSLGKAFKQFSIYIIALRTVKKALNEASRTIRDLDKYLTEQAMVTGKTREQTYALLESYQAMASELGATTKEVAEVATQFLRQGKTAADALTLTRAAISAAKVAGISAAESVNYLTTAVNGFQLTAQDAMRVSDKFAALAASAAVSYEEVATALSKVAAQANLAGMSIDYTTALLTKGIETTREPAESIGTALKTIVARMREITDYGKTLEDGVDLNNVETQLAYVDIQLRNQNGELRATEDVLNDLGGKWDTLSQNQQAAVAKALAGTRQQSRLIAMMQDYDRVIELQEIAQRSAGATSAQAAVYLEGMEAALNKINVAWEKIVSSVIDSDVIINILSIISGLLDRIGDFLSTDWGMITTLTTAVILGAAILGQKVNEMQLAKMQQIYNHQRLKDENKINQEKAQQTLTDKQSIVDGLKKKLITAQTGKQEAIVTREKLMQEKSDARRTGDFAKLQQINKDIVQNTRDQAAYDAEISRIKNEDLPKAESELNIAKQELDIYKAQGEQLASQDGFFQKISIGLSGIVTLLMSVVMLYQAMAAGIGIVIRLTQKEERAKMKAAMADKIKAAWGMASSASAIPVAGWVIAAGILLAILGVSIGVAIANNKAYGQSAEKAAEDVNTLSNEIYKLQEKANAIKSIEKQYDALDNKIIKTSEDVKEMNDLLDKAADKLSEEEKQTFSTLVTNKQKRDYLTSIEQQATDEANFKRAQQRNIIRSLGVGERNRLLDSNTTNADFLEAQSAIFALNNNALYAAVDNLKDVKDGVEQFTQSILENMTAQEAWTYAQDESGKKIEQLLTAINNATTTYDGQTRSLASILDSDDIPLRDRIAAYNELEATISSLGDPGLLRSFRDAYQQWEQFQRNFSDESLDFIERSAITTDNLNNLSAALQKFGLSADETASRINTLFSSLEQGGDLARNIMIVFDDILSQAEDEKEWKKFYARILNAYEAATGVTLTNIGQNITSLKNQISKMYETAAKWSSLSESEKTDFIQANDALFRGEGGDELRRAFETGNYNLIQEALANNNALKETIQLRLRELELALQTAEARREIGEENEFEIAYLKEQIALLEDFENTEAEIYRADLKLRLEQEQAQLNLYKEYLQKQKDALEESLDKRKEAYQKYFDAVNQQQEDEDYDKQATTLITNLSKLASSTNGTAVQQSKELERQFAELEEERLKTLRERAQEAVLSNLDNEVSQINEKFDKLLEDQAQLLAAMKGEIAADPNAFVQNMLTSGVQGMTATSAEDYIRNQFTTAFDSILPAGATDAIKVSSRDDGTLILNINGTEIPIGDAAQQDLYITVMNALKQLGLK